MKELLKNIEYKIKSATKGITTENRGELTFLKTIIDEYNIKKVLFLRQDRIGDLLISSPLFRILKEKYPDIEFDILLSNYNTSAYELVKNYFSNAYLYHKKFVKDLNLVKNLRAKKYDLIIDLMDKPSSTSALLIKIIKPKYAAGLEKSNSDIYNFIVKRKDESKFHIIERTAEFLTLFGLSRAIMIYR